MPCLANLVEMFGQFVRRRVCFPMLRPLSRQFLCQHLATLKGQKCDIDSCKWPDLQKSFARGAVTDWRPFIPNHSRCFNNDTKGADGATDLLEVLRNSPVEKLSFAFCSRIPSAAWQKLRGASWTNLREARFVSCLVLQTWLRCLASSLRCRVLFPISRAIVTAVSLTKFGNIERPKMWNRQLQLVGLTQVICKRSGNRLPSFCPHSPLLDSRCFDNDTKGADGAADLLEVLRNSPLEKLYFGCCYQIPSSAWQKLRGASWTHLKEAHFYECLVLQTCLRCLASSLRCRVFFPMLRAIATAVSLPTFGNIERPKMWHRQLQMAGLAKVICKRSGNRLTSFYSESLQVLQQWHQRCRWGRRPAGSLAELSPGGVGL